MKLLFEIDKKNYDNDGKAFIRPSARAIIIKDSIKEYGYVHRVQKADEPSYSKFVQDNYYYICDVENKILEQQLDDYENFEKFTLELVDPKIAININRNKDHGPKDLDMIEREAKVLELLIKEGYFN